MMIVLDNFLRTAACQSTFLFSLWFFVFNYSEIFKKIVEVLLIFFFLTQSLFLFFIFSQEIIEKRKILFFFTIWLGIYLWFFTKVEKLLLLINSRRISRLGLHLEKLVKIDSFFYRFLFILTFDVLQLKKIHFIHNLLLFFGFFPQLLQYFFLQPGLIRRRCLYNFKALLLIFFIIVYKIIFFNTPLLFITFIIFS